MRPGFVWLSRLTVKMPGYVPKLRGMRGVPAAGRKSKLPKRVTFKKAGLVEVVAKAGRSRNCVSPLLSKPVVMLKGRPEVAMTSGFRRKSHQGSVNEPPKKKRWRTSIEARRTLDSDCSCLAGM